jgi:hypothetical protein
MKTIAALTLLVLSVNAAVVKRQGHSNNGGTAPGSGFQGFAGLTVPGLDLASIAKTLPKGGLGGLMGPTVRKAYKIEEIPPQKNPKAKRIRITYGPYKIRGANASL